MSPEAQLSSSVCHVMHLILLRHNKRCSRPVVMILRRKEGTLDSSLATTVAAYLTQKLLFKKRLKETVTIASRNRK